MVADTQQHTMASPRKNPEAYRYSKAHHKHEIKRADACQEDQETHTLER